MGGGYWWEEEELGFLKGLKGFGGPKAVLCLGYCRYGNSAGSYCEVCIEQSGIYGVTGFGRDLEDAVELLPKGHKDLRRFWCLRSLLANRESYGCGESIFNTFLR